MKVYTLLKQLDEPCKIMQIYGKNGTLLYKGVLNNVPWHIAKCELKDTWEVPDNITWAVIKG